MSFMLGLVLGGAVGAAAAWLYEPEKGQERREALRNQVRDLTGRADEIVPGAGQAVRERVPALLEEQKERIKRAAEEAQKAAEQARQELTERYRSAKRTGTSDQ